MTPPNNDDELKQARIVEPPTPLQPIDPPEPATAATHSVDDVPRMSKKRRRLLPVLIVVGVLALLGGSTAAAYSLWYQNSDRVMADAMSNLLSQEDLQQNTVITSDSVIPLGFFAIKLSKVSLDSAHDSDRNNSLKLGVDMEFNSRPYQLGGEAIVLKSGDVYFKLNDMKDTYLKFLKDMGAGDMTLTSRANELIAEIDNTWVKTNTKNTGSNNQLSCVIDSIGGANQDAVRVMKATYADNQFMSIKEKLAPKDGNLGYRIQISSDKMKQFVAALRKKDELKDFNQCIGEEVEVNSTRTAKGAPAASDDQQVDVWVSRWSHELQAVHFTLGQTAADARGKLTFKGTTKLDHDQDVSITAPSDARTLQQWLQSFEELNKETSTGPTIKPAQNTAVSSRL